MKWLTNTYDPSRGDWARGVLTMPDESPAEAVRRMRAYLSGKLIGAPKATKKYTVEELINFGYVGVYVEE